jgi:hypothetical protein
MGHWAAVYIVSSGSYINGHIRWGHMAWDGEKYRMLIPELNTSILAERKYVSFFLTSLSFPPSNFLGVFAAF